ncbi:hypothetical protein M0802_016071 [Mischocyttarus mexicanus]|nr:hypothetical protein M0802_016071 [Mischocyttarus mexicanus]
MVAKASDESWTDRNGHDKARQRIKRFQKSDTLRTWKTRTHQRPGRSATARQRKRDWRNLIAKLKNNRLPKIAQTQEPNTSRQPGRPSKRWYESWTSSSQEL